jgi:hypothetical protein
MNMRVFWRRFKVLIAILIIIIGFYIYLHPREFGGGGGWFFTPDLEIIGSNLSINGIEVTSQPIEIKRGDILSIGVLIKNNVNESQIPAIWILSNEIVDIGQYALWYQEKCSEIEPGGESMCKVEVTINDLAPLGKTDIPLIVSVYEQGASSPKVHVDEVEFNVKIIDEI